MVHALVVTGITTAGYSLPWERWMVTAYACASSSSSSNSYGTSSSSSVSTVRRWSTGSSEVTTPTVPLKTPFSPFS